MEVKDLFEERLQEFLNPAEFRVFEDGFEIQFSTKRICIPSGVFLLASVLRLDIKYIQVPCDSQDFTLITFVRSL